MSLLLTDKASPGLSDGMMPGFLVEDGGYGKIGNYLFFLSMDHVMYLFI